MKDYTRVEDFYDTVGVTQDWKYLIKYINFGIYLALPNKDGKRDIQNRESMWEITTYILYGMLSRYVVELDSFSGRKANVFRYKDRSIGGIFPKYNHKLGYWKRVHLLEEHPFGLHIYEDISGKLLFRKDPIEYMRSHGGNLPKGIVTRNIFKEYKVKHPGVYEIVDRQLILSTPLPEHES